MSLHKDRSTIKMAAERAVVAAVRLPSDVYNKADPFGEIRELVAQAGAEVVGELSQARDRPQGATYMGKGKIEELAGLCELTDASTIVFDHELSPRQIGNIEQATERKVIDRSELILDIFAGRATSHEAKLQVELAQLEYTYPRLRAMWDHLERIVGGAPAGVGTRGPGEQQIEIDRRLVQRRKTLLQRELVEIQDRKRRAVQKRNAEHFTVGLVGYTNAGKSTLFNTLTAGGAYADDRLFATLMTRTRAWDLGGGHEIMLSDTIGFVRDLPHHLVASFQATLEEATHADLLLIVLDVSDPSAEQHYQTVQKTLAGLYAAIDMPEDEVPPTLLLLNKADRLADNRDLVVWRRKVPDSIAVCALPGDDGAPRIGAAELVAAVRSGAIGDEQELTVTVPLRDSRTVHTLEQRAVVLGREYLGDAVRMRVRIGSRLIDRLRASGAAIDTEPPG